MTGPTATTFAPNEDFTRAMVVATLYRMVHGGSAREIPYLHNRPVFSDVGVNIWYSPYVVWAYDNGIVGGVGNNRFAPNESVTREAFAVMLHRFAGAVGYDTAVRQGSQWNSFTDRHQISTWAGAREALIWANYHGMINGRPPASIAPGGTTLRAEAAAILMRFIRTFESQIPEVRYEIHLNITGTYTFPAATVGYDAQSARGVIVTNTGNQPTGNLTVALNGASPDSFQLDTTWLSSIEAGGTEMFTVAPRTGLAVGTYAATVTVSGANVAAQSFVVRFTVDAPPQTFGISLNTAGTHTFPAVVIPYTSLSNRSVVVTNTGNQPTGNLTVGLSGANPGSFYLGATALTSIAVGGTSIFNVRPQWALPAGTHTATITVSGDNVAAQSFVVSFTVNPSPHADHASNLPRSQFTLPNRRATEVERQAWINEYRALGHPLFSLEVVRLINIIRAEHGLSQVQIDDTLMMAARYYAQIMANLNTPLGHNRGPYATDPNATHGASRNVAEAFGGRLRWNAGNGAAGQWTAQELVNGWMNSPGHRAYILSPEHRFIGTGSYLGGPHAVFHYMFLSDQASVR